MDVTGFKQLRYVQIATASSRDLQLDQRPAVYSWYRSLELNEYKNSKEAMLEKISSLLNERTSDEYVGKIGYLYKATIVEQSPRLSRTKQSLLDEIASSFDGRDYLARFFERATYMQAPLYIGKANKLRDRVNDHLNNKTQLVSRLKIAGIEIDNCVLRYRYTDADEQLITDLYQSRGEEVTLLLEELLTKLGPAKFVRRPG